LFDKNSGLVIRDRYCEDDWCWDAQVLSVIKLNGVPANPLDQGGVPQEFEGSYTNGKLTITLIKVTDVMYQGMLQLEASSFDVAAFSVEGGLIKGYLSTSDEPAEFSARLEADSLVFTQAGNDYYLNRLSTVASN